MSHGVRLAAACKVCLRWDESEWKDTGCSGQQRQHVPIPVPGCGSLLALQRGCGCGDVRRPELQAGRTQKWLCKGSMALAWLWTQAAQMWFGQDVLSLRNSWGCFQGLESILFLSHLCRATPEPMLRCFRSHPFLLAPPVPMLCPW